MLSGILHMIITGLLVRADGWGADSTRWKPVADFLNVWTCGMLFGLLMLANTLNLPIATASFVAFVLFRSKGFRNGGLPEFIAKRLPRGMVATVRGWQNWSNMFIRTAVWCSPAFAMLSYAAHGNLSTAWLALPFAAVNASIYGAAHRMKPWSLLGFDKHVFVELLSGATFYLFSKGTL